MDPPNDDEDGDGRSSLSLRSKVVLDIEHAQLLRKRKHNEAIKGRAKR